ncbi:MAG TPA: hypothetical protein VHP83_09385 [Aggregatilineaceae bacterium]|nr:hypothetical protein [Aggregatilineaceae bacterium]
MQAKTQFSILVLVALLLSLAGSLTAHAQDGIEFPEGTPITLGETVQGELTADAPIVNYTFEAKKGDAITAYTDDDTYTAIYVVIGDPRTEDVLFYSSFDPTNEHAAYMPLYLFPDDGTYNIAVTCSDYFYLQETPDENAPFSLTVEAAEYETLAYGDAFEGEISLDNTSDIFIFEGQMADIPYITLETDGNQMMLDSLTQADFSENEGNRTSETKNYYISPFYMVDPDTFMVMVFNNELAYASEAEPIAYTLKIDNYDPQPIASGETVEVELSVEMLLNYLKFEGKAGEVVTITIEAPNEMNFTTILFDVNGEPFAGAENSGAIETIKLPGDGTYIIGLFPADYSIDPSDLDTLSVTLTVE